MSMILADVDTAVSRIAEALPRMMGDPARRPQPFITTVPPVVHRIVERHAALRAEAVALREGDRTVTWRELNNRANAVARHLMANGLRRGDVVAVEMPVGADLAIVLLAVLKAGGCYTWAPDARVTAGARVRVHARQGDACETIVDVAPLLAEAPRSSPNLPVMVRGTDAACQLPERESRALLPHASLAALQRASLAEPVCWSGEPGALDLWIVLMSGGTAHVAAPYACAA